MRLDHVGYAARSLEPVERTLRERYGLGVERLVFDAGAGAHVPLAGHQYVEIHTPHDRTAMGQFIERLTRERDRWWAWSVEVDDFDDVVRAKNLVPQTFAPEEGTAATPWSGRHAGTERIAPSRGLLPYLITYEQTRQERDDIFRHKHSVAGHDREVGRIAALTVGGDEAELTAWLGVGIDGVTVDPDPTGIVSVSVVLDGEPTPLVFD